MCRPSRSPLEAETKHWTDETIFMSLFNFKSGKPLPLNVTSDINPYQDKPSNLPAGLWYLSSGVKKDVDFGFWEETEAACEIFSNSVIVGLRTTLRYHEGRAPHGRKTDWLMHEYRITNKYDNDPMDFTALCRVFLADENGLPSGYCSADINVKISINLRPKTVLTKRSSDHFFENSAESGCILTGDYIELNDLVDSGSCSSSSSDSSSCLTVSSEEYFDSMALLQELQDNVMGQEMKDSSVKSKEVVLDTVTSGSMRNNKEFKRSAKEISKVENKNRSTAIGVNITSSSFISENKSKDGNNEHVTGTKRRKMMKYICFLAV